MCGYLVILAIRGEMNLTTQLKTPESDVALEVLTAATRPVTMEQC